SVAPTHALARLIRQKRGQDLDRVNPALLDPLLIPKLVTDVGRRLAEGRNQANASHRREVPDHALEAEVGKKRFPDLGLAKELGRDGLAWEPVIGDKVDGQALVLRALERLNRPNSGQDLVRGGLVGNIVPTPDHPPE